MQALMDGAVAMKPKGGKIITLLGAEGGGRDVEKRPAIGAIAAKGSDYVIICNVDPYNDPPMQIIDDVARGATEAGAKLGKDMYCIEDRREAIAKALSLAQKGDMVLITGKGSEQSMVLGDKKIPWDDRNVVREELKKLS
jgi:UDP-N-acetylmuramoyl-L-alanyl-D-glutamate--2,6-diaminopimelate ligase